MWKCPDCPETHPDELAKCWRCGGRPLEAPQPSSPTFSIRALLAFLIALGVLCTASYALAWPEPLKLLLTFAFIANLLGALVAWFITYVLRLPNDGALRWQSNRARDYTPPR